MIRIVIPGRGEFVLHHLVMDVNGTIACDGRLLEGVRERLDRLRGNLELHLVTADTHGAQQEIDRLLDLRAHRIGPHRQAGQKSDYIRKLGPENVAAVGNGANDALMLEQAAIGILVIGREGAAAEAWKAARVIVFDVCDALDLLLRPARLSATLRR